MSSFRLLRQTPTVLSLKLWSNVLINESSDLQIKIKEERWEFILGGNQQSWWVSHRKQPPVQRQQNWGSQCRFQKRRQQQLTPLSALVELRWSRWTILWNCYHGTCHGHHRFRSVKNILRDEWKFKIRSCGCQVYFLQTEVSSTF